MFSKQKPINKSEIFIIGAGIFGICSGFFLAKRGYKVSIVDMDYIAQKDSGINAGSIAVQNKDPENILLARKSIDVWNYFGEIDKSIEYKRCGGFRVAETESEAKILKADQKKQQELGLKVEYLENKDLLKAAPYLSKHLYAANYCEFDGFANARIAARSIAKLAIEAGVKFILRNKVNKIKIKSNTIRLETNQGIFETEKLILASGAWTGALFKNLGIKIPIHIEVNQLMVSAPESSIIKNIITHINGKLTVKQLDIGTVVIGGGWKGMGSLIKDEQKLLFSSIEGNSKLACQVIPCISNFLINRIWSGFNGTTKDKLPLFGKLPGYENIYINGICSVGFTLAPYLGMLIAELIDKGKNVEDVSYLNPDRFIENNNKIYKTC